jgi:protein-disulfide isomerase
VKYVIKDFPLESIHKLASKAAEAADCAGEQGKYWEMRKRFFANQKDLKLEEMANQAGGIGLNREVFQQCLNSGKFSAGVLANMGEGQKAGIRSVPSFLIGFAQPDERVKAVKMIKGAQPYSAFKEAIESLLPLAK